MRENISHDNLAEISDVSVDRNLPKLERIAQYIRQVKDPYHYKCGEYAITAKFAKDGPSLEDCLQRIMT